METVLLGKKGRIKRMADINDAMNVLIGNRGWKDAFLIENPHFNNSDGLKVIQRAYQRTSADEEFHRCIGRFLKNAYTNQPDWFKKQLSIEVDGIKNN
jgi:hypothetical protein